MVHVLHLVEQLADEGQLVARLVVQDLLVDSEVEEGVLQVVQDLLETTYIGVGVPAMTKISG